MASLTAFDAIKAYLDAQWTGATLIYENEAFDLPSDPSSFVVVEVFGSFFAQETTGAPGNNLWREGGQLCMHVMALRGTGSGGARTIASDLASLFREQGPAGLTTRGITIGAGEPGEEDGNYWRMTVTVDWERDDFTTL